MHAHHCRGRRQQRIQKDNFDISRPCIRLASGWNENTFNAALDIEDQKPMRLVRFFRDDDRLIRLDVFILFGLIYVKLFVILANFAIDGICIANLATASRLFVR
jgi:hypothetical protein